VKASPPKRFEMRDVASAPNALYAFTRAFFEELARSGVEEVCVSPGSRSTPLAVTAATVEGLRLWSILDERSAGFFALGLAKASRRPVALVCTSGSALANYAPAVVEAHYAGVPLIVSSADRPPELREWGAGQTIDQVGFFGDRVRYFAELPIPTAGARMLRFARAMGCRAVAEASGLRPGPVHLNWPFREPLEPIDDGSNSAAHEDDEIAKSGRPNRAPYTASLASEPRADADPLGALAKDLAGVERGVIACGLLDEPGFARAAAQLARTLGWPLLADPVSGARAGQVDEAPVLAGYDLFLRDPRFQRRFRPEVVLRLGGSPTCKALRLWLEAFPPERLVLVGRHVEWSDPSHLASDRIQTSPTDFCTTLAGALAKIPGFETKRSSAWLEAFLEAEAVTQRVIDHQLASAPALFEPAAARSLAARLPDDAMLYVSNSMPVRDLDAFMAPRAGALRVLANRGTNGIDGMVSSSLGASAAGQGRAVLLTGDLACLYDIGALLTARRYPLNATLVVLNNDGGGIFSFLPVAAYGEAVNFDELFNTPHGADLSGACSLYGVTHRRVTGLAEYEAEIEKSFSQPGVTIIEVAIDGRANTEHFREVIAAVHAELDAAGLNQ